ncbi:MAG: DUF2142 domain-containing protein [Clostridia bacterium]|nr:DUF2142 domain-containing protein [Clostridia bacterium]
MKEWMLRSAAGLAAMVLLILFFAVPTGEENYIYGSVYDGRAKYELAAGESVSWEWAPEEEGTSEFTLRAHGAKNAPELELNLVVESLDGEEILSAATAISELNEEGDWTIQGLFHAGTIYRISLSAGGEGSIKLRGTEEEGFKPSMNWAKKTLNRYGTLLYLAIGFGLLSILPLPARRKSGGRVRRFLLVAVLFFLSTLWFVQTLGIPQAYSLDEAVVFAWCLHYGAWIYLTVMGKLLFGTDLPLEKKAAIGAIMLGILFMFAITPNAGPDESSHFDDSYGVSNYLLFQPNKAEGNALEFDVDGQWEANFNSPTKYAQIVQRLFEPRGADETKINWVPTSFSYPLMFLPQALGLAVGRLLRVNPLWLYYLGRFFNLLFYALCVYLAVRAVPRKKELFFGIGLLPMAIHQAASYSYDAFTNGLALLWTALALRTIWRETPMEKKEYLSLILVGAVMAPSKVVYIILAGLLFLIPKKRFVRWNKPFSIGVMILTMAVILAAFWIPSARSGSAVLKSGSDVYTLETILRDPIHILRILFYSAEENLLEWLAEATGFVFCGYSLWIDVYLPVAYLLLLVVLSQKKVSEPELGSQPWNRAMLLLIICGGIVLLEMVEVLIWTPVGANRVFGIQGRYFIPLMPVIFLALETKSIQRRDVVDDRKLLWALVFLHAMTIDHILMQTFHI